jgi:simple sugar transport system substrate-binding protein
MSKGHVLRRDYIKSAAIGIIGLGIGAGIGWSAKPTPPKVSKPAEGMYFRLLTQGEAGDVFFSVVEKGMKGACEELGCSADMVLSGEDLSAQIKALEAAIAMKPDGIAVVITDDQAFDEPIERGIKAGINIIGFDTDDSEGAEGNARLAWVGQDFRNAGRLVARRVVELAQERGMDLSGAHLVMPVEVPGIPYGKMRAQGIRDILEKYGVTSEILDCGGSDLTVIEQRESSYLIAHPETKIIIGLGSVVTGRIMDSMKTAGVSPDEVITAGFDVTPSSLEAIKAGYLHTLVDAQQYLEGYFAIYVLYLMKRYGFITNVDTGGFLIDKSNIAIFEEGMKKGYR